MGPVTRSEDYYGRSLAIGFRLYCRYGARCRVYPLEIVDFIAGILWFDLVREKDPDPLPYPAESVQLSSENILLFSAIRAGGCERVEELLEEGANPNAGRGGPAPALQLAAFRGQIGCVEVLLDHGADPGITNSHGRTPAEVVKRAEHLPEEKRRKILDLLRRNGPSN